MAAQQRSSCGTYMWKATRVTFSSEYREPLYCRCILGSQCCWTGRRNDFVRLSVVSMLGQTLHFTNDMDIDDHNDAIYLTDSSSEFNRRQSILSILITDKTGKLVKYNITSKQVSLSKDESSLLIFETTTCKILRYWLEGPNAGTHETFAELPGQH